MLLMTVLGVGAFSIGDGHPGSWRRRVSSKVRGRRTVGDEFALADGEVQVWSCAVADRDALAAATRLLTPEEISRAGRTRAGLPREEFCLGRGLARFALHRAAGLEAVELRFGKNGKPEAVLGATGRPVNVHFNVAHSGGRVMVAVCRNASVGVDMEQHDPAIEAMDIASHNFAPAEVSEIERSSDKADAFYRIWVMKEAVLKCQGLGLSAGLEGFGVGGGTAGAQRATCFGETCFVRTLDVGAGFHGALAVGAEGFGVRRIEAGPLLGALLRPENAAIPNPD